MLKLLGRFFRGERELEVNSGIPVESSVPVERPPTIEEMVRMYIKRDLSAQAVDDGYGSFEDEDDFSEDDDGEQLAFTHHQVIAMTDEELRGVAANYGVDLVDHSAAPTAPEDQAREKPGARPGSTSGSSGEAV